MVDGSKLMLPLKNGGVGIPKIYPSKRMIDYLEQSQGAYSNLDYENAGKYYSELNNQIKQSQQ